MTKPAFEKWAQAYRRMEAEGQDLMWPSETLIRLLKGDYVAGLDKDYDGKKVIDIGFGNGNNLIFLASLGMEIHGAEVDEEICRVVGQKLKELRYQSDLRVGTNRQLPFPEEEFDFLVSWNVLHYEDNEEKIDEALAEYRRVLKTGGRFFISTTGPTHLILKDSKALGNHRYEIGKADDFRKGQVFFYFDAPDYVQHYFEKHFANLSIGRVKDDLFNGTLDWFIITGTKN